MNKKSFYLTTTLPYVNADPHIGFAMEIIRADTTIRWKKSQGYETFFNTGTDEHGQKLFTAAQKEGKDVQEYVDGYAKRFQGLTDLLGISQDVHFIRTTDEHHIFAAQEFWKLCNQNGHIYKKKYQAKYCVGCELEKTDSELDQDGECPLHKGRPVEVIDEENYFFKFSDFQKPLLEFYDRNKDFVVPDFRFNEIRSFVERGLEDFSISRLKSKMSWGVPVPGDEDHVMYVWFDALVNYISTLGWPENTQNFEEFWINGNPTQYCGKDNLRQQSAMWQAMLMAANLPNSHRIIINGFITGDGGVKMSKSLGNVINPYDIVESFGADALRLFLLKDLSSFEDSPFTIERFKSSYNSSLANGLGNLSSRILTLSEKHLIDPDYKKGIERENGIAGKIAEAVEASDLQRAVFYIWEYIGVLDTKITQQKPFSVIKTDELKGKEMILELLQGLYEIAYNLKPFLPVTSDKLIALIELNKKPETPLFQRLD